MQNGAVNQKDALNDDEFEPYLNTQARQVSSPLYRCVGFRVTPACLFSAGNIQLLLLNHLPLHLVTAYCHVA